MFNRISSLTKAPPSLAAAKDLFNQRRRDLEQAFRKTEDFVIENPAAALAVAFAVGLLAGWWLKRR